MNEERGNLLSQRLPVASFFVHRMALDIIHGLVKTGSYIHVRYAHPLKLILI
jgi:hypothetical protein